MRQMAGIRGGNSKCEGRKKCVWKKKVKRRSGEREGILEEEEGKKAEV